MNEVCVEMMATEMTAANRRTPVEGNPRLQAVWFWPILVDTACGVVEGHPATTSRMTTIALCRFGVSKVVEENPITLCIGVDYRSDQTAWPEVIGAVKAFLGGCHEDLHVHMEHYPTARLLGGR
jgi:hypothetical protein